MQIPFLSTQLSKVEIEVLIIVAQLIPETLFESSFTPIYPFVVKRFLPQVAISGETGYYAGLLTTAFYIPLLFFNPFWGYMSDRAGRKPIILLSLIVGCITNVLIAFSSSYSLFVGCRVIAGCFGANSSVVKGFIGDLSKDQRVRSWAYAVYGSVFGICALIGPLLGAVLCFPVKLYPSIFAANGFFDIYPFFIMSIFYAILNLSAIWLTLYYIKDKKHVAETTTNYDHVAGKDEEVEITMEQMDNDDEPGTPSKPASEAYAHEDFKILSWKTIGPILLYCSIAFTCMTYYTLLPLFFAAPISKGGLGLDARKTSFLISMASGSNLIMTLTNYVDTLLIYAGSSRAAFYWSMLGYIPAIFLFPLLTLTSGWLFFLLEVIAVVLLGICEAEGFQASILGITESQQQLHLGKAHGLATSMAAVSRAASPAITGILWDWSVGLGWNWYAFAFCAISALLGAICVMPIKT